MPDDQITKIETDEQFEETVNIFEESLNSIHTEKHVLKHDIEENHQFTMSLHEALTEQREFISMKRPAAKDKLLMQVTKMSRTSKRKFPPARIGDTERVQVSDDDRSCIQISELRWRLLLDSTFISKQTKMVP